MDQKVKELVGAATDALKALKQVRAAQDWCLAPYPCIDRLEQALGALPTMKHQDGCTCRECSQLGYRLEQRGDFWVRLLSPSLWPWLERRRIAMSREERQP